MRVSEPLARELWLALKFAAVSLIGFLADYAALKLGYAFGLGAAVARLISLVFALQVTFLLSRRLVFGRRGLRGAFQEWSRFMAANGFGGLCNYGIFVALAATRWPLVSTLTGALILSASIAYAINYAGTRLFVYGRDLAASAPRDAEVAPTPPRP